MLPAILHPMWVNGSESSWCEALRAKIDWQAPHRSAGAMASASHEPCKAIEPDKRIVIEWDGYSGRTAVEWKFFAREDGTTYVVITESG